MVPPQEMRTPKEIKLEGEPKRYQDPNGDVTREQTVEYGDTKLRIGRIEDGPSKGLAWAKWDSPLNPETAPQAFNAFGIKANITSFEGGRGGVITGSSSNPDKPRAGDTWYHSKATLDHQPEANLPEAEYLTEHPKLRPDPKDPNRQIATDIIDGREEEVFSIQRIPEKGITIYRQTSFRDGYKVTTGRKITERLGPGGQPEKVETRWEEWRATKPEAEQALNTRVGTDLGALEDLHLQGFSRDLAVYPQEQDQMPIYPLMHGTWSEGPRYQEAVKQVEAAFGRQAPSE